MLGGEIGIDPQSIFRNEMRYLFHDPADLRRRKEIKKKVGNHPVVLPSRRFPMQDVGLDELDSRTINRRHPARSGG